MTSIARAALLVALFVSLGSCDILSAELSHFVRIGPESYDTALAHACRFTPDRDGILVRFPESLAGENILYVEHSDSPQPILCISHGSRVTWC
jgi:hypothetical protein